MHFFTGGVLVTRSAPSAPTALARTCERVWCQNQAPAGLDGLGLQLQKRREDLRSLEEWGACKIVGGSGHFTNAWLPNA